MSSYDGRLNKRLESEGLHHIYPQNGKGYSHIIQRKVAKPWWNPFAKGEETVAIVVAEPNLPINQARLPSLKYSRLEIEVLDRTYLDSLNRIASEVGTEFGESGVARLVKK